MVNLAQGGTRAPSPPKFVANVAVPFIDRSSEMWNFRWRQNAFLTVLAS